MKKMITAKKIIASIMVCFAFISVRPAHAFVWPTLDMGQISSFVTSITSGITTITNAKSQIDNVVNTIKAIGDQIATFKKYFQDIKNTIMSIKEAIEGAISAIVSAVEEIKSGIEDLVNTVVDTVTQEIENVTNLVNDVKNSIDRGATEEETQAIVEEAKAESEENRNKTNQMLDEALVGINKTLDDAKSAVDILVQSVNEYENMQPNDREALLKEADDVKNEIDELKNEATTLIENLKNKYNEEYSQKISKAYDEYSKAIEDYYAGKITKEELDKAGEKFKETVASVDIKEEQEALNDFSEKIDNLVDSIETLKENILNAMSNDKEYSDEDEEDKPAESDATSGKQEQPNNNFLPRRSSTPTLQKVKPEKISFKYINEKQISLAKSVYSKTTDGKPFLLSKELLCKNAKEEDIEKLEENNSWFRTCVARAKTELDFYPDVENDNLYKNYMEKGVFRHILHDYSVASIVTISKAKQFVTSWRGKDENSNSEYKELQNMISEGSVDNVLGGVQAMASIDLWAPRLWSNIRRVDAIDRAKRMLALWQTDKTLYLDNRSGNEAVVKAISNKPGSIDDKKIFPHVTLQLCKTPDGGDISAKDISVKKGEDPKTAEENIEKCMFWFATNGAAGLDKEEALDEDNITELNKLAGENKKRAVSDAIFENLTHAVITNYKSTRDYMRKNKLDSGEENIITLQDGIKDVSQSRDGYAAGAKINHYTTQQLLNIVEAKAINLQAEILKDLPQFGFDYFPTEE